MTHPVYWSTDALNTLGAIFSYVGAGDPDHALWLVARLEAAADRLGLLPTGRPGRVDGTFEKSLPELRYVLVYEVDLRVPDGPLVITRVVHTSQNWP